MYYILYNIYGNLGMLSAIKMPYLLKINNLYFDMDISLYNYNILDIFVYIILLLLLLLLTIIYYSSIYKQEKILVNFNEYSGGLYDSGDDIDCSSSSDEGNYTSDDSDDGEDDDIKLSRRRRRWDNNREYISKYSGSGRAYNPAKNNNNKNFNTYIRAVRDEFYATHQPGIPRNHLMDKKMYKDTVRELNKANLQNPNLNLDLDTLSRVHANRYHKLLYKKYDYTNLSAEQLDIIAKRHNIKSLNNCKDFLQSVDSEKLRVYLKVSEKIHEKYIQRTFLHTSKWDG
jgi:hypothetical protein